MGSFANKMMSEFIGRVDEVIRKKALKEAVEIVKKDMKEKVIDRAVMDYYMDYIPTRYKRSYSLFNAFQMHARQNGRTIHAWIEYDSDKIGEHYSHSPRHRYENPKGWVSRYDEKFDPDGENNGVPQNEWIFDQFWAGIHPIWYIDREMSREVGEPALVDYSRHFESTESRMLRYASEYQERMDEIISERILAHLE